MKLQPFFDIFGETFDILTRDPFEGFHSSLFNTTTKVDYPYNIKVNDNSFNIEIAAIGLDKKDINIDVEDNKLIVSSNKPQTKENKDNYIIKKLVDRNFTLSWDFQADVDLKNIEAILDKGLLIIKIPKKKNSIDKKLRIEIQ